MTIDDIYRVSDNLDVASPNDLEEAEAPGEEEDWTGLLAGHDSWGEMLHSLKPHERQQGTEVWIDFDSDRETEKLRLVLQTLERLGMRMFRR